MNETAPRPPARPGERIMSTPKGILGKLLFAALVVVAGVGGYALWQQRQSALPAGITHANGRLEATEVDVASKLAGRLLRLAPREGSAVHAGQVVGQIDVAELEAQRDQAVAQVAAAEQAVMEAEAAVASARTSRTLAGLTFQRTEALVERGFLSHQRLDVERATLASADANVRAALAKVDAARAGALAARAAEHRLELLVADGALTAPIDGRVLYRLVEPGTVVAAGGKVLTLIDLSSVYMTVFLPAEAAGQVNVGDAARIMLDAWPARVIPAQVDFIADKSQFTPREVETRSEREKLMFRVKVAVAADWLADNGREIKPGMAGVAWLRTDASVAWPDPLVP
jgi:HlyD family secretion protein